MSKSFTFTPKEVSEAVGYQINGGKNGRSFGCTVRGVQVNLEGENYAIPLGEQSHLMEEIITVVEQAGFIVRNRNLKGFRMYGRDREEHLLGYKQLIDCISECEVEGLGFGRVRHPLFMDNENLPMVSAIKIRKLVENGLGHLLKLVYREVLYADVQDQKITKGQSKLYREELKYREHVVPCVMIAEQAAIYVSEGKSDIFVADFIKNNLVIMLINNDEAYLLDYTLKLRDRMPNGWA